MNAVSAQGVRKSFGAVTALNGIDLEIRVGEFYGLLGPNGAGKTTLLRILSGLLAADVGTLEIAGVDARNGNRSRAMGVVPQGIALYDTLTGRANLQVFGGLCGFRGAKLNSRIETVLDAVGLTEKAAAKVKTYSGGMMRRLNLAVGLLHDPAILLLDEPTVGVDPQSRAKIFALLTELNAAGKTIIYTTHYMEEAERLCQRIGILDHGRLLKEGSVSELLSGVKIPRSVRVYGHRLSTSAPVIERVARADHEDYLEYTGADQQHLGDVVATIERSGLPYERLEIVGPNLESLFLQLTGRELRD